jgi:hypothetical protein
MAKLLQPSLAGGEVSPAIGARVDLSKRAVAVALAENFIPTFTGALARSRPGQEFVARCKPGSGAHRILDFEFSTDQTYVIELGDAVRAVPHERRSQILDSSAVGRRSPARRRLTLWSLRARRTASATATRCSSTDVGGMTELNGRNFLVANATANTFELQDLNGVRCRRHRVHGLHERRHRTPPYEIVTPYAADRCCSTCGTPSPGM